MAGNPPIVRQISWPAFGMQLAIYAAAVVVASLALGRDSNPVVAGVAPVLLYSFAARYWLTRSQRDGVRLMKAQRYDEALRAFQASYDFFGRHPWLDRYRAIVLMSASAVSYREMALASVAFCHEQAGRVKEARAAYQRTIEEFPESGFALDALRTISSEESADHSSQ